MASVKPTVSQPNAFAFRGGPGSKDPGRLDYQNVTLKAVLQRAYDVEADQIAGPGWLDTARYDIQATMPPSTTKEQFMGMLQSLVSERFHLAFHREKKDFEVYELQVAKGGPKLKKSVPNADAPPPAAVTGRGGPTDRNGFPLPPAHQTAQRATNGLAQMTGNQITMMTFAQFLKFPVGFMGGTPANGVLGTARVVNKTGLEGEYDLNLQYQWPGGGAADDTPASAPTLFTALQQQLGLRLERTKQQFDVLVIDRADKTPVEN